MITYVLHLHGFHEAMYSFGHYILLVRIHLWACQHPSVADDPRIYDDPKYSDILQNAENLGND